MAHMKVKWLDAGKGTEKWRKILVIAKGKMSLSRDTESLWTSRIDKIKWEGKSMVRCSRRDRVIVRKRVKNECHNHVKKPRTFCKVQTVSELTLTPIKRALTKSGFELIFGHSPQTLTTRVVRKLYLRDMKHICNKLRCDSNARTSNASRKERYWKIKSMHIGVKLLDEHRWTCDRDVT